ncbi:MAG: efflux transporter protein [Deltaproteobacteria bacterium]|nr:efflux transporter protein [Deltaproteobacteria bacterium]
MTRGSQYSFKRSLRQAQGLSLSKARVQTFKVLGFLLFSVLELLDPLKLEQAFAQANFYQGKTITMIVGTKAGDVYDLYPRLLAEYLPKYIPGNPNIIIQNVPGAASLIAANQLYNLAKPDGLTLGAIYPALYFDQLVKRAEAKFDWNKFTWIGSPVGSNHMMYMRTDTPFKTVEDVRAAKVAPKCGTSSTTSTGYYIPKLLEEAVGAKFDIVTGYQAGQDVDLAVERGEVVCRSFTITAFHAREPYFTWRKNNFVRVLYQTGNKRDARLKEVPTMFELMDKYKTTDGVRRLAKVVLIASDLGRPIVAPPSVSPDRLKILREAFDKSVSDPAFLAEAERRRLEIDPSPGQEIEALAKEAMSTPPDVVERMKKLLGM